MLKNILLILGNVTYDYGYNQGYKYLYVLTSPFSIALWIVTFIFFWRMTKLLKVALRILLRNERQIYRLLENLNERLRRR